MSSATKAGTARALVADQRRACETARRPPVHVEVVSPNWVPAVGPVGTLKKEFTARVDGAQVGRLLLYHEVDGRFDISGIGVHDLYRGRRVATQLLDFAFSETGADHFTLSTGTTGDGTQLVSFYGEGRRGGRRVVERPARLGAAARAAGQNAEFDLNPEDADLLENGDQPGAPR